MVVRLYSVQQITSVTRFSLAQLEYLRDIELVVPSRAAEGAEHERYDDLNLLRLQQIRVGRARRLALEEIRRWLLQSDCGLPLAAWPSLESLAPLSDRQPCERQPSVPLHQAAPGTGARRLFLQTEAKVETDAERHAFQAEASELYSALARLRASGIRPADPSLARWVERHRFHIERWFCTCAEPEHLAFGRGIAANLYLSQQIQRHGRQLTAFMLSVLRARTAG